MKNKTDNRHQPIIINNDGDTVQIPESAKNFNYWNLTISQVMDLEDGPKKKFYLVKYIRQTQPQRSAGIVLKRSSCQDLIAVFLSDQTLDNSIILKPVN